MAGTIRPIRPKREELSPARRPVKQEQKQEFVARRSSKKEVSLRQQRPVVVARVVDWQKIYGWVVPVSGVPPSLQPLLEEQQNRIYVNWRDVRPGALLSEGMLVECMLSADAAGLVATDVSKHFGDSLTPGVQHMSSGYVEVVDLLEESWARQNDALGEDFAVAVVKEELGDSYDDKPETGELLPGWEEHWSEEHSTPYYWHDETKKASWQKPVAPETSQSPGIRSLANGKVTLPRATPITPAAVPATRQSGLTAVKAELGSGPIKPLPRRLPAPVASAGHEDHRRPEGLWTPAWKRFRQTA